MTKLVLSNEKSNKLISKLNEVANLEVKTASFNDDEMVFFIEKKDEAIFFKLLSEIIDESNEIWLDTFDGQIRVYPSNCLYFEFVVNEVILVTDFFKQIYLKHSLQELEEKLVNLEFQRISKSAIVNLKKITYVKPLLNSKIELTLPGNLKLQVNRSYLKDFKKSLKEKGGF